MPRDAIDHTTIEFDDAKAIGELSERLQALMRKVKIRAAPLARRAGRNESAVRDILRGRSKNPGIITMRRIAKALDMSPVDVLHGPAEVVDSKIGAEIALSALGMAAAVCEEQANGCALLHRSDPGRGWDAAEEVARRCAALIMSEDADEDESCETS